MIQRLFVTASGIFCVLGTLVGVGVLGTRVEESSGGALSAEATLIAPAGPAFSVWSVIYLGLLGYVIWQWTPAGRSPRATAIGWLAGWSMILNASWLLVTQQSWLWVSVAVILALLIVLGVLVRRLVERPAETLAERIVVDGTFGLYLGWVCVAVCANITATMVADGITFGAADPFIAALVVAVAGGVGVFLAWRLGGRWAVALGIAWGLSWLAVGRLTADPRSVLVGVVAILAAVAVLAAVPTLGRRGKASAA